MAESQTSQLCSEHNGVDECQHAMICPCCGWVNPLPNLKSEQSASCGQCGYTLIQNHAQWPQRVLALSVACLCMFVASVSFSLIGFSAKGAVQTISLTDLVSVLFHQHYLALATIALLLLIILPLSFLIALSYLASSWVLQRRWPLTQSAAYWCSVVQPWLMVDVFVIALLVSLIKLHSLAAIELGYSFWAYCFFAVLFVKLLALFDHHLLWSYCSDVTGKCVTECANEHELSIKSCHLCGLSVEQDCGICPRCHQHFKPVQRSSLKSTLALLLAATLMYIPANYFPVMTTTFLGQAKESTIMGGVLLLWQMGSYPVALVILIASVFVPSAKILSLLWLCWQCRENDSCSVQMRQKLYLLTEFVGRWSMIDVFVVALLSALVQLGALMNVTPGPAVLPFASVVVLTMLAAKTFDPKLLWRTDLSKKEQVLE
ncbi:PqiA/YebS family transporter subunit [Celerinatantimonas diazotrophica]|uniref:Paraquat-inducible protein A n=1 Tax=Celerinatantimonas diazotrophica TaxID=412034 RepID=A0A4R1K514_9GAMM|nr:PqiA/YebS family transporter subunit [Celerinatantimonas diazotrophica]TCK59040.1 paraquat-inducible protein A [Celerinatantimonas diazotrophica]CAG9297675.1 Intermembrane transport protein PqiA [Celerinatantimonas diazotrophica]